MTELHILLLLYRMEEGQHIFSCVSNYPLEPETERQLQLRILLCYRADVKVNGYCEFTEGVKIGKL